MLIMTNVK